MRNMETPLGSAPLLAAWQAERKGGGIPGRERMPGKQMPAAERQQETRAVLPGAPPGAWHNWPDTGPGARARKRADVRPVSC